VPLRRRQHLGDRQHQIHFHTAGHFLQCNLLSDFCAIRLIRFSMSDSPFENRFQASLLRKSLASYF
jgi:hypothetical protein